MSQGRVGARAALVAVGVLASVALMAAPSWAKGGNSTASKLCEPAGYPGVLLNQQAEAFKNEGACTSYASKGGQLAGVNAVGGPASPGEFEVTSSGFGLKPGSTVFFGARYQPSGTSKGRSLTVAGDGTFSNGVTEPCEANGSKVGSLVVQGDTAAGTGFVREFAPPSGC
jgi:hypothetical protein